MKKAKALLDEAGWKQIGDSKVPKDGKALTMTMYYDKGSSSQRTKQSFYKQNSRKWVFNLQINGDTSDKVAERRTSGDYDLMFNQTWDYCMTHKVQ